MPRKKREVPQLRSFSAAAKVLNDYLRGRRVSNAEKLNTRGRINHETVAAITELQGRRLTTNALLTNKVREIAVGLKGLGVHPADLKLTSRYWGDHFYRFVAQLRDAAAAESSHNS